VEISRRDLRAYLALLPVDQLVDLVVEAASSDAGFGRRVTLSAAAVDSVAAKTIATYRAAIRSAVGERYVEWDEAWSYACDLDRTVDSLQALLAAGNAAAVVELADEFITLAEDAVERVHDDGGEMIAVLERLSELHLAACRKAKPDRAALAERLFARELAGEWGVFDGAASTYRTVLGKPGLARFRECAACEWERVPERGPGAERHDARTRRLATIMEGLAGSDVDELAEVKSRDLSSPERFAEIACLYGEAGDHDTALAWALNGLDAFPDAPGSRLRAFLVAEYARRGRHDEAVAVARAEFEHRPTVDAYRVLGDRAEAAGRWPEVRAQARAWLHDRLAAARRQAIRAPPGRWSQRADFSALVAILLSDEDLEAAWAAAVDGGCGEAQWLDLARRRRDRHPVDARGVFQRLAQEAIERPGEHRYDRAIELIREAGELMGVGDYAAYRAELNERHGRKRNFVTKLNGLA